MAGDNQTTKADRKFIDLCDLLVKNKMTTARKVTRLVYRRNQCMACNKHSFSVMPNGDLIKCCESSTHVIGNVVDGITNPQEFAKWVTEDLAEDCRECVLLPMCQGGCRAGYLTSMEKCIVTKEILPEILRWYVGQKEQFLTCGNAGKS